MSGREKMIAIVGAVLLAVGSTMEWASVSAGFISLSVAGTAGDGKLTLIAGGLALLLFATGKNKGAVGTATVVAGLGGAVAIYDVFNVSTMVSGSASASVGIGLWLCVAGGVAATVAGAALMRTITPAVATSGAPAAWLTDPTGRHQQRYWNGQNWTEHVSTNGTPAVDPIA